MWEGREDHDNTTPPSGTSAQARAESVHIGGGEGQEARAEALGLETRELGSGADTEGQCRETRRNEGMAHPEKSCRRRRCALRVAALLQAEGTSMHCAAS